MKYQVCKICGNKLPLTEEYFYWRKPYKNRKGAFRKECKECKNKKDKERYEKNHDKYLETGKKYHETHKEQHKKYRELHKEHIKEEWAKYYKKNKERLNQNNKIYRLKNKEIIKAKSVKAHKIYYDNNREKIIKKVKEWTKENKEYRKEWYKKYRKTDRGKTLHVLNDNKRRTLKRNAIATLTNEDWQECLNFFNYKDAYTGLPMEVITQDHVIPISKHGSHTKQNVIPCEANINSSKSNKNMETWYKKQTFFSEERLKKIYKWMNIKDNKIQQLSMI